MNDRRLYNRYVDFLFQNDKTRFDKPDVTIYNKLVAAANGESSRGLVRLMLERARQLDKEGLL